MSAWFWGLSVHYFAIIFWVEKIWVDEMELELWRNSHRFFVLSLDLVMLHFLVLYPQWDRADSPIQSNVCNRRGVFVEKTDYCSYCSSILFKNHTICPLLFSTIDGKFIVLNKIRSRIKYSKSQKHQVESPLRNVLVLWNKNFITKIMITTFDVKCIRYQKYHGVPLINFSAK